MSGVAHHFYMLDLIQGICGYIALSICIYLHKLGSWSIVSCTRWLCSWHLCFVYCCDFV